MRTREPRSRLLDLLQEVVRDACGEDSQGMSSYAEALRLLAEQGRCRIVKDVGRRVIVEWVSTESPTTIRSGS